MTSANTLWLLATVVFISIIDPAHSSASSSDYPLELCLERTYWRPLPKPDGVIGFGYNAIRGPVSTHLFNATSYEGVRPCRLTIKTKPDGRTVVEGYRLPGYVEEYRFSDDGEDDESDPSGGTVDDGTTGGGDEEAEADEKYNNEMRRLRFTLITYESTAQAFMEMRKRWGFIMDEGTEYENLFFTLNAPLRYYGGQRYRDLLQGTVKEESAATPFYTLRVEAVVGRFSMKPYRFAHFAHKFAQKLRDATRREIVDEESTSRSFFDMYGTHYPLTGTFGGIDERRISFLDYFDARCGRKVTIDQLATCDGLKLKYQYGFPNVRVLLRPNSGDIGKARVVDLEAAKNDSWDICKHEVDAISRVSAYVASAGGKLGTRMALHTQKRFPADLANIGGWRSWLESIPSEPATVKTRMAPICELVPMVDRRPEAKEACQRRLVGYLRRREHVMMADNEACDIATGKMAVGFESKLQPDFWDKLLELKDNRTVTTYCVPTDSFDRISPCPQANQQEVRPYGRARPNRPHNRPFSRKGQSGGARGTIGVRFVFLMSLIVIIGSSA